MPAAPNVPAPAITTSLRALIGIYSRQLDRIAASGYELLATKTPAEYLAVLDSLGINW